MTNKENHLSTESMTIGNLAKASEVNVETVRYYQRIGLVNEPDKPQQGYRRYPTSIIDRIRFIKRAQDLGFTLNEITDLLSLNDGNCEEARTIAEHKREVIQQRIEDLNAMQRELTNLIEACKNNIDGHGHCAIIEALTKADSR